MRAEGARAPRGGRTPVPAPAGEQPDQNAYITGKAFIPFYFGPDRHRMTYFYKGVGRVVFSGGGFSMNATVSRVEYDPGEPGHAR